MSVKELDKSDLFNNLAKIVGRENVVIDTNHCYAYSFDATNLAEHSKIADAVVFPSYTSDVSKILAFANQYEIPIVARCAATNHVGGCVPKKGGIVVDFAKMNKIININQENLECTVQPGVVVGDLQKAVEKMGLFYPPDPSNLNVSMIGGSVALSSGGPRSFKYGATKDYVIDLEVVLADGTVLHSGANCAKNVTGYNLTQLFVGSEGTLGLVTEASFRLIPKPECSKVLLAYFDKLEDAPKTVNSIIEHLIMPAVLDLLDKNSLKTIEEYRPTGLLTDKEVALLIELDGSRVEVEEQYKKIISLCYDNGAVYIKTAETEDDAENIWNARRASFGATAKLAPVVVSEDIVVPRENIVKLVEGIRNIVTEKHLKTCIMGHVGDGNIHPNIALDPRNKDELARTNLAIDEIFDLAIELGGTLTGEHGIGSEKIKYMPKALSKQTLAVMKMIKNMFDPKGILNPGKIFYSK
ncbi:MAG: FAD-linked oxidase C-terminal domain-containing protein [Candidatus Gastranaerophilales bacterium]|nr:FAD-linked oxidase C-terminal domain-containing protein [Candidatus Gastranaerophilales bacterium]